MIIQTLILQTSQLPQLAAFYSGLMDLPVVTSGDRITITAGRSNLIFRAAPGGDPFYHFAFNIPANKIEEAHEWMLKKRVPLLWMEQYKSDVADFVNWNAKSIYFFDPAGNIVELIARFDLDNAMESPFSSKQILSICPGCEFTEHYFPGFDPKYEGMDWRSLRLVYKREGTVVYLVGVVHDQWTS